MAADPEQLLILGICWFRGSCGGSVRSEPRPSAFDHCFFTDWIPDSDAEDGSSL